jgi:hypothetical protein
LAKPPSIHSIITINAFFILKQAAMKTISMGHNLIRLVNDQLLLLRIYLRTTPTFTYINISAQNAKNPSPVLCGMREIQAQL